MIIYYILKLYKKFNNSIYLPIGFEEEYGRRIRRLIHQRAYQRYKHDIEPEDNDLFHTEGHPNLYYAQTEGVIIQLDLSKHDYALNMKRKTFELEVGDCFWYGNYLMVQTGWMTNRDIVKVADYYSQEELLRRHREHVIASGYRQRRQRKH